jgi:hypothetical protein
MSKTDNKYSEDESNVNPKMICLNDLIPYIRFLHSSVKVYSRLSIEHTYLK